MKRPGETSIGGEARAFPETLWTAVVRARDRGSEEYRRALDELVRAYWKPVYYFIRHRGMPREAAKDLTQEFFAVFLEKDYILQFDREKGRFKTFLLVALKHFLSKQRDKAAAKKRGGDARIVSGDLDEIERLLAPRLSRGEDPERAFAREWAVALLQRALRSLEAECSGGGKQVYTRVLFAHMSAAPGADSYRAIAQELQIGEGDVRNYLHRVRARLKDHIVRAVREYVEDDRMVEAEIQELLISL